MSDAPIQEYEIHTNRELEFMLERGKPLAHFYDVYPPVPAEEIIPRKSFAPHVASGQFEVRVYVEPMEERLLRAPHVRGTIHFLYALADQFWRIDAYISMQQEASSMGWTERLERLQGTLLGYTDAQNDAHIARLKSRSQYQWLK